MKRGRLWEIQSFSWATSHSNIHCTPRARHAFSKVGDNDAGVRNVDISKPVYKKKISHIPIDASVKSKSKESNA
jgi:hypothetical protein